MVWTCLNKTSVGAVQSYKFPWESCYGGSIFLGMWLKSSLHCYICQEYATAIRRHEEISSHASCATPFWKDAFRQDRFQTWVHPMSRLSSSRIWFDASLPLNDVISLWALTGIELFGSRMLRQGLSTIALPLWVCSPERQHSMRIMVWGCPSACACGWRGPHICQEYATAIRRHEENISHLLQRNAVPEQSSKAHIPFGKVERCIWDRFQTWVHPMSRLVWQQDCKLCRASARCFNNCITSVSLTTVWTRLLQVHLLEHVIKEFRTSVKSMPQPSNGIEMFGSRIANSAGLWCSPSWNRRVEMLQSCFWNSNVTNMMARCMMTGLSHQPHGETPCRHRWLAKDACLYWSSKMTAEKMKQAHPIKHLYLSCKPALRCGLDRKCCYVLRRVGWGH